MRLFLAVVSLAILACACPSAPQAPEVPPIPEVPPSPEVAPTGPVGTTDPVDRAVAEWIEREVAAAEAFGEAVEIDAGARAIAIRAFLAAHPDVAAWETPVQSVLESGSALTLEEAWKVHQEDKKPLPPVTIEVSGAPYRALIIVGSHYVRSEDWGFFVNDVDVALTAQGVVTGSVHEGHYAVHLVRDGATVGTVDTTPYLFGVVGYLFVMEGKEPLFHPHDMPDAVLSDASAYFGVTAVRKEEE
ncbi:MAG: hypothetical protein Q8P18_01530 [Pseudomonadota bacterium]|nr:hypothetical protein [Pseudomonadota bacterium]